MDLNIVNEFIKNHEFTLEWDDVGVFCLTSECQEYMVTGVMEVNPELKELVIVDLTLWYFPNDETLEEDDELVQGLTCDQICDLIKDHKKRINDFLNKENSEEEEEEYKESFEDLPGWFDGEPMPSLRKIWGEDPPETPRLRPLNKPKCKTCNGLGYQRSLLTTDDGLGNTDFDVVYEPCPQCYNPYENFVKDLAGFEHPSLEEALKGDLGEYKRGWYSAMNDVAKRAKRFLGQNEKQEI